MQRRTVIVEGPDGAGKSTLIQVLAEGLGRSLVHTGGPRATKEEVDEAMRMVEVRQAGLFDRCSHISNPIYASVDGRQDPFTPEEYRARLASFKPIVVYCRLRSVDRMLSLILSTTKAHKPPEYLETVRKSYPKIVDLYDRHMSEIEKVVPVIRYSWDEDHPLFILQAIREIEQTQEGD